MINLKLPMKEQLTLSNVMRYFHIAEASKKNAENLTAQINEILKEENNPNKLVEYASSAENEVIISIVFSVMTLEAFINEYGIKHTSKTYFKNHLDNLKLISKFIIIPKLTNDLEIENGNKEFENLKWLLNLRNEIVHYKNRIVDVKQIDMTNPINQKNFLQKEHAQKAINTVREIIKIIDPNLYVFIDEKTYYNVFQEKKKTKKKY